MGQFSFILLSVLLVKHLVWKLESFGTHKVWNVLLPQLHLISQVGVALNTMKEERET